MHVMSKASFEIIGVGLDKNEVLIESGSKLGVMMIERTNLRSIRIRALLNHPTQTSNIIPHPMNIVSQHMKLGLKLMKRRLVRWRYIVRIGMKLGLLSSKPQLEIPLGQH